MLMLIRFRRYTEDHDDLQIAINNFGRCDGDRRRTNSELLSMQLQAELVEQNVSLDKTNFVLQRIVDVNTFIVWAQFDIPDHNPIPLLHSIDQAYQHGVAGDYTILDFVGGPSDLPFQKQISEWLRLAREYDPVYFADVRAGAGLIQDRCRRGGSPLYNDGYAEGVAAMLAHKYGKTADEVLSFIATDFLPELESTAV